MNEASAIIPQGYLWYLLIYIIPTIVGGFLAASAVYLNNLLELNKKKKYFLLAIKDDLENCVILYQRVMDEWSKSSTVWFVTLDEVMASRKPIQQHHDFLLTFPKNIRRRVNDYYLRSENIVSGLKVQQLRKYDLDKQYWELFAKEKTLKLSLTDEQIRKNILNDKLFRESMEYDWLTAICQTQF